MNVVNGINILWNLEFQIEVTAFLYSKKAVPVIVSCFSRTLSALQENMCRMVVFEQDTESVDCIRILAESVSDHGFDLVTIMNKMACQMIATAWRHFYNIGIMFDDDDNIEYDHFELLSNSEYDMLQKLYQAHDKCEHGIPLPLGKQIILFDDIIREDYGSEFCQLIEELLNTV